MTKTARNIETLPKWAQREILRLQRDVQHLHGRLSVGPCDSRVLANPYSESPTPLGDATVEFKVGPGARDVIRCRIEGNRLDVNGGNTLIVVPSASNAIQIKTERM